LLSELEKLLQNGFSRFAAVFCWLWHLPRMRFEEFHKLPFIQLQGFERLSGWGCYVILQKGEINRLFFALCFGTEIHSQRSLCEGKCAQLEDF
jgi:hypothetical protein